MMSVAVLVYFMRHREQADGRVLGRPGPHRRWPASVCSRACGWCSPTSRSSPAAGSTVLAAIPFAGLLVGPCSWRPAQSMSDTGPELRYGIPRPDAPRVPPR